MTQKLEEQFREAMISEVYEKALKECGYPATNFLQMVEENGGLETAKQLLYDKNLSYGFLALEGYKRLDLTMEALILKPKWKPLFSAKELAIARKRLKDCGFPVVERETGTVKWFNESKGYGFIARPKGGDVFVHHSAIRGEGFRKLSDGDRVEYEVVQGEKGPQAQDVVVV